MLRRVGQAVGSETLDVPTAIAERDTESRRVGDIYHRLLRQSVRMREVEQMLLKAVGGDDPVFVTGETGTGKELIAELVHVLSPRTTGPWVKVRCSALPGELLESELFGDELRAIGGGDSIRPGRLEQAHGGTLCLDEITDLPLALQAKLLGFLHEGRFMRNGGGGPGTAGRGPPRPAPSGPCRGPASGARGGGSRSRPTCGSSSRRTAISAR